MSGPIETAYQAMTEVLAERLVAIGLLTTTAGLQIDPEGEIAPEEDEEATDNQAAAGVFKGDTRPVRALLGGPRRRWVVERTSRLELAVWGPDRAARRLLIDQAVATCSTLAEDDPTLSGQAEQFEVAGVEAEPFPPNGEQAVLTFTLRVRAGDPLGGTS